ncbi:MAG: hypothetical protein ACTSPC_02560 [Candidatus Heimdallarchaeota archaeon]
MTSDSYSTTIYKCKLAIMKHMYQFYDKNHTILELESKFSSYYNDEVRHSIDLLLKEGNVEEVSSTNLTNHVGKSHLAYKITTKGMHVYSKLLSPKKEYTSTSTSKGYTSTSTSYDDQRKRFKRNDRRCVIAFFTIFAIVFIIFVILIPLLA